MADMGYKQADGLRFHETTVTAGFSRFHEKPQRASMNTHKIKTHGVITLLRL